LLTGGEQDLGQFDQDRACAWAPSAGAVSALRSASSAACPDRSSRRGSNASRAAAWAINGFKHWRGLATRYDKHAVVYRGALVLAAALLWINDLSVSSPACSVSCRRLASFA
jgi:hypothetical protein